MKLELSRRGDYAVRAMLTLARPGTTQLTSTSLVEATAIPNSFLPQVMGQPGACPAWSTTEAVAPGGYRLVP